MTFEMNGVLWRVKSVPSTSNVLIDRMNKTCVATTDPMTRCVYLSDELEGEFKKTVLLHELGHCAMFSYGLIDQVHSFTYPEDWIFAEEWACNFIADYAHQIFDIAKDYLDDDYIWEYVATALTELFY